jgi:hypothetical protein
MLGKRVDAIARKPISPVAKRENRKPKTIDAL